MIGGTAQIWRTKTAQPLASLRGHEDWVRDARFGPNEELVIIEGGSVRIWHVESGRPVHIFPMIEFGFIFETDITDDGSMLAITSSDQFSLYNIFPSKGKSIFPTPDELLRSADELQIAPLTDQERVDFFLSDSPVNRESN